ncbi:OB-fold domain-containing protein [Xenophilus arseniciresistens]|uniref:OB-fold domain-containing protein n=1 Tax=Xenophilus arseniciresistens TaxID=1283306 RepID=A0AAE3NDF6_9BURK|nr:OB-fold domain-containing protein [Xenophilus arseniciresistens]MDA7419203.1 OB-fold domain-containing protein [Xenophilus arseniciresistens]
MTTPYSPLPISAPQVDAATAHFLAQAREGVLSTRRCTACGKLHWYPRALCPFCMGDTEWVALSGQGTIYSVSVTRRAGPTPYAIAYVTLDEGITLLTNIVDCDLDSLKIGQRVAVTFKPAEDGASVPMFRPA